MRNNSRQTVVILHGIGHSLWNMVFIERALKKAGYRTLNLSYPSRKHDIETLSGWLNNRLAENQTWENSDRVHFVGHSMGGLVAGTYLQLHRDRFPAERMGRVVMLGTPHGGSEVADFLHQNPLYKYVFGSAGQQLTTHARRDNKLQPWYELGIIAGSHNWAYPFGLFCIREMNDGCVSISSSKLDGMKDHVITPALHGFMGWMPEIHTHILSFLENGEFRNAA